MGCATIRKILVFMLVLSFRIMSVAKNLRHIVIHMMYYTTIRLNDLAVYYIIYPTTYNTTRFLLQSFIRFSPKNKITLFRRSNCILSHIFYKISCKQTCVWRKAVLVMLHIRHAHRLSPPPSLTVCVHASGCLCVSLFQQRLQQFFLSVSTRCATMLAATQRKLQT